MTAPRYIVRQRDFSGGEVVEHAKRRDDEAVVRSACRTLSNVRILSSGAADQRPGRSAIFAEEFRVDQVRMSSTYSAKLCFGNGTLTIRNSSDIPVARAFGYAWAEATVDDIVWDRIDNDIVITFAGQIPKIARWDGGTEWTFEDWAAAVTAGGQKRVPFLRISPKGVTMLPAARTGTGVAVTFSDNVLFSGMVGTRMRFINRQVTIATVLTNATGTIDINEPLPGSQVLTFAVDPRLTFALGEVVEGSATGSRGIITASNATTITVQLTTVTTSQGLYQTGGGFGFGSVAFTTSDSVVGPGGGLTPSSVGTIGNPVAVTSWDEEVFNSYRGWPRSVTSDQSRMIFCDFPAVPHGIGWSALLTPDDFYPGAEAAEAIFETMPKRGRIYHVMGGADEFVLTDSAVYYVPISESNPLRPGSVAFRRIPGAPSSAVRPVDSGQGLIYVGNGLNRVLAIVGTGQTSMPWQIRPASDLHSHLFSGIRCLAFDEGDGDPPDETVYAVNSDGTVAVGRYQPGKEWVGWLPWSGEGDVKWASALNGDVVFTTVYVDNYVIEQVDDDQYLDAAVSYNAIPAALGVGAQASVLVPDDQGSLIGNMTLSGGLIAAFDGTTSQAAANAANRSGTSGYVGKTLGQRMRIAKVEVWPSSNSGFTDQTNITVQIKASQGTAPIDPASAGSLIGTTGSIADTTSMQSITSTDLLSEFDHLYVLLTPNASGNVYIAEVRIYTVSPTHGSGELWFVNDATVNIMDERRVVGTGSVDTNGEIAGVTTEQIGFDFDVIIEPFLPHAGPGQAVGQTMTKRQLAGVAVAVQNSTGFEVQSYKANESAWVTEYTREPYNPNNDTNDQPPLREEVVIAKPVGSEFDPRIRIYKNYAGPVRVLEISDDVGA